MGDLDALLGGPPPPPPFHPHPAPRPGPRPGAPQQGAPRPSRGGLLWKGLALVGVAVVSGLVWLMLRPGEERDTAAPTSTPKPAGEFTFTKAPEVPQPVKDSRCAEHAYGQTKEFLTATPCQQLTRGLYTTTTPDGRTAYSSVSVVRMKSEQDATKLKELTARDGTGNVNDLVKDGAVKVEGLRTLANGGFAAVQRGQDVVIVETDTARHGGDEAAHNALMKRISTDAFRLAADLG
ncbi:hypothetical protein JOF41_004612 [Saccharothrix coeruleofusca]|uniref:hypothetical protein n=1 Tax=Saccharothrix coeruleofusca TaxID=33919 RepID=UPI001AE7B586|nr:hypothetical protein [Saccharothrix coeruleofusca]MBP2338434.1 hypothetical protein [Saccharothrix coeruleofusca]